MSKLPPLDFALVARFGTAGILSTLVHLLVVWAASRLLGWPLGSSNALAYAIANGTSWLLQSRWTFRNQPRSWARWLAASAALLAISGLCGHLIDILLPQAPFGWLLAVLPVIGLSFFIMRHWVFARASDQRNLFRH